MSLDGEALSDRTEARQERLRTLGTPEAAHPALAFTRGLVAVFGTAIDPGTGFDEHMVNVHTWAPFTNGAAANLGRVQTRCSLPRFLNSFT
jgi:hypothetical protein